MLVLALAKVAGADGLIVERDTTLQVDATYDSVAVMGGATLTANGTLTTTGDFRIAPGGVVAHGYHNLSGLQLNVGGTLWIQRGASPGQIVVSNRGLWGGGRQNPARCDNNYFGEAYDATGALVCGAGGSAGGSYGGSGALDQGGVLRAPYGLVEVVDKVGSGGGCEFAPYNPGGNGGGLVRIEADAVVVDGEIHADGESIYPACHVAFGHVGGGSGGGVSITTRLLSGSASGVVSADGGTGSCGGGGGGGGGRIAIYVDDQSGFLGQVHAYGGLSGTSRRATSNGAAGSVYVRPSRDDANTQGTLRVANADRPTTVVAPLSTNLASITAIEVTHWGSLQVLGGAQIRVLQLLSVTASGEVRLSDGSEVLCEGSIYSDTGGKVRHD